MLLIHAKHIDLFVCAYNIEKGRELQKNMRNGEREKGREKYKLNVRHYWENAPKTQSRKDKEKQKQRRRKKYREREREKKEKQ